MHSRHIVRSLLAIAAIVHPLGLAAQGAAVPSRPAVTSSRPGAVSRAAAAFHPDRLARIDSWIESLVAQRQIPGAVVMLVKDGQVVE